MQNFVILWRSFPIYLALAGAAGVGVSGREAFERKVSRRIVFGRGASRRGVSGDSTSLDAKVFNLEGLLGAAKQGELQ